MILSISRVKLFKACRRAYELKYIEGLEPVAQAEALITGQTYHSKLEELYNTGDFDASDLSKESAMATAYKKYIYPKFNVLYAEGWEDCPLGKHKLIGRVDGLTDDGRLVEHKTTSLDMAEYEFSLQWDEQILAYMAMTGTRKVCYTVCRKPTIRKKKNESDEDFFNRMVEWYDEDTDSKLSLFELSRTDEEIDAFIDQLKKTADDMENPSCYYRNTTYCRMWGRQCDYAPVCLSYDPSQEYVEFTRRKREE